MFYVANGSAISCCTSDGFTSLPLEHRHYACMPIQLPREDPFFSHFKQGCMNFVRSVLGPRMDCTLGYAQQVCILIHLLLYKKTSDFSRKKLSLPMILHWLSSNFQRFLLVCFYLTILFYYWSIFLILCVCFPNCLYIFMPFYPKL